LSTDVISRQRPILAYSVEELDFELKLLPM
jgi:hypothetical protein